MDHNDLLNVCPCKEQIYIGMYITTNRKKLILFFKKRPCMRVNCKNSYISNVNTYISIQTLILL